MLSLAFQPDGNSLVGIDQTGAVAIWNASTGAKERSFIAKQPIPVSEGGVPSGQRWIREAKLGFETDWLIASQNRHLVGWNVRTGKPRFQIRTPGTDSGVHLAVSSDGKLAATSDTSYEGGYGSNFIHVWDLTGGHEIAAFDPGDSRAISFAFSSDNQRLLMGMDQGNVLVWDLAAATSR